MKRLALTLALLSITAFSMMAVSAFSDDPADKKIDRKYAKSFVGEDLNRKNFSKQNLDNSNFEDADLTGTNFEGSSMKNCNFRGATMKETRLMECDLTGSDFREASLTYPSLSRAVLNKVNFEGLDLSTLQFNELKVRGANFRDVKGVWCIYGSDFFEADLRGANFTKALESSSLATFRKAKYDQFTRWHDGFDPKAIHDRFAPTLIGKLPCRHQVKAV